MNHTNLKMMTLFMFFNSLIFMMSSNSLYFIWVCFEINLMVFIPLFKKTTQSMANSLLKYFIIQAISSNIFILCCINLQNNSWHTQILYQILFISLWIKMGFFPFQTWFYQISENMDWLMWLWLNTFQKIVPLWLLSFKILSMTNYNFFILLNSLYSLFEIFNQTSMRWMINSSSLNHFSWMVFSLNSNLNTWQLYFIVYFILSFLLILNLKTTNWNSILNSFNSKNFYPSFTFMVIMMNFMGLPPFIGFLPKLIVIFSSNTLFVPILLILMNLIFCLVYLQFFSSLLLFKICKNNKNLYSNANNYWNWISLISLLYLNLAFFV